MADENSTLPTAEPAVATTKKKKKKLNKKKKKKKQLNKKKQTASNTTARTTDESLDERIVYVKIDAVELQSKQKWGTMNFDELVEIGCTTEQSFASHYYGEVQTTVHGMAAEATAKAGFDVSSSFSMTNSKSTSVRKQFHMGPGHEGYIYQMYVRSETNKGNVSEWNCDCMMTDHPLVDFTTEWRDPGPQGNFELPEGAFYLKSYEKNLMVHPKGGHANFTTPLLFDDPVYETRTQFVAVRTGREDNSFWLKNVENGWYVHPRDGLGGNSTTLLFHNPSKEKRLLFVAIDGEKVGMGDPCFFLVHKLSCNYVHPFHGYAEKNRTLVLHRGGGENSRLLFTAVPVSKL